LNSEIGGSVALRKPIETRCCLEVAMGAKFDIFKRLPDGHPIWIKAVEELEEAKVQIAHLTRNSPGEYFIYSVRNGCVIQAGTPAWV
jgi:hypothetical protein